jgi:hypothetical protein
MVSSKEVLEHFVSPHPTHCSIGLEDFAKRLAISFSILRADQCTVPAKMISGIMVLAFYFSNREQEYPYFAISPALQEQRLSGDSEGFSET